jgi:multiple sugar transport system permease protein
VFLSPWLIGLFAITLLPTLYSLYVSFTEYDFFAPPQWVGLSNYKKLLTQDPQYWQSVRITLEYVLLVVPLKLGAALGVALLVVRDRRGVTVFRSLFYLPSLLGGSVAVAIVWYAMFGRDGAVNDLLSFIGIHSTNWVSDPGTAIYTVVLLGMWQFGAPMVIFVAGLKQIPVELYEAAAVDGASRWRSFWSVTVPALSPVIFFNLVLEVIHAFQQFTSAFVIGNGVGGALNSLTLYTVYLYFKGWRDGEMGYATAMAWVLLIVLGLITAVLFRTGRFWVHYSDEEGD